MHFKQHLEGRGFHAPPHPPPANPVSSYVSDVSGKSGLKMKGGGGKAIFSELKIADFPETLDPTP